MFRKVARPDNAGSRRTRAYKKAIRAAVFGRGSPVETRNCDRARSERHRRREGGPTASRSVTQLTSAPPQAGSSRFEENKRTRCDLSSWTGPTSCLVLSGRRSPGNAHSERAACPLGVGGRSGCTPSEAPGGEKNQVSAASVSPAGGGGSHNSIRLSSGSMTHPNLPYSDFSVFGSTLQPSLRSMARTASRSWTM